MFRNGKHLHYSKLDYLDTIHGGNTNNTGIRFQGNCIYMGKYRISVSGKRDTYEEEALRHRIKFCRIKRIPMGGKYHYYVQIILEGYPPKKHITGFEEEKEANLKEFIHTLKSLLPSFEDVFMRIRSMDGFSDVTEDMVRKYY